jgi:hypothetical protein
MIVIEILVLKQNVASARPEIYLKICARADQPWFGGILKINSTTIVNIKIIWCVKIYPFGFLLLSYAAAQLCD